MDLKSTVKIDGDVEKRIIDAGSENAAHISPRPIIEWKLFDKARLLALDN